MKYLNLGCGSFYSKEKEWVNVDFISKDKAVLQYNLLKGIPFPNDTFDAVYHSHVLEHFSKSQGAAFIRECFRVLKPGGILRVVVPDLEQITRNYIKLLELGLDKPDDLLIRANYEWIVIEMYDQVVRAKSGGEMADYLAKESLINESFVYERLGEEAKSIRKAALVSKQKPWNKQSATNKFYNKLLSSLKSTVKNYLTDFRKGGEIHQWMYDKYSIHKLLSDTGFHSISSANAFMSMIPSWERFNLDGENDVIRKPDSLFSEALK